MEGSSPVVPQNGLLVREVYQRIREVSLGLSQLTLVGAARWRGMDSGEVQVAIDDLHLMLIKEDGVLDCSVLIAFHEGCWQPTDSWSSRATDPLELLSVWERKELLKALEAL